MADQREKWARKHLVFLLLIFIAAFALRTHRISYPFVTQQDSGYVPTYAKNIAEYGLVESRFLNLRNRYHNGDKDIHIAHPPLTHLLYGVIYRIFGPTEAVYRVSNLVTGGVTGAIFLLLLLSRVVGVNAGLWALAFWAVVPSSAYFERIYAINMHACSLIVAMLYLFFSYIETKKRVYGVLLHLTCVLGALTDWHFGFIFPFLFLYVLLVRKHLKLFFSIAVTYGGAVLFYITYAAYAVAFPQKISGLSDLLGPFEYWKTYAQMKINPDKAFNQRYLSLTPFMFYLHFSVATLGVPVIWILALLRTGVTRGREAMASSLAIPLLLAGPGLFYVVLTPRVAFGHYSTFYWFTAPLAAMFGITADSFFRSGAKKTGMVLVGSVSALLLFFSIPNLNELYRLSEYHVNATRTGKLVSLFSDKATYAVVDNYDTIAYYIDLPLKGHTGHKFITSLFLDTDPRLGKPSFIVLNQSEAAYRSDKGLPAKLDREFSRYGYRRWLDYPSKVWTHLDTSSLYLFTAQGAAPFHTGAAPHSRGVTVIKGANLYRGFYQPLKPGSIQETVFKNVSVNPGLSSLRVSIATRVGVSRGATPKTRYGVAAIRDGERIELLADSVALGLGARSLSVDIRHLAGQTVDFVFTSEALVGAGFIYWVEPRLMDPGFTPALSLTLEGEADIQHDKNFRIPLSPPDFSQALAFWKGVMKGILHSG